MVFRETSQAIRAPHSPDAQDGSSQRAYDGEASAISATGTPPSQDVERSLEVTEGLQRLALMGFERRRDLRRFQVPTGSGLNLH